MKVQHRISRIFVVVWLVAFLSTAQSYSDGVIVWKDGNITLKGLFPITFRDVKTGRCDKLDTENGLLWMMAMVYAVDEINNSSALLPNITLGYEIDNTCRSIPTAMSHAIDIVAKYRPNSVCRRQEQNCREQGRASQRPSAVVGPAASWISIPMASLLGLYNILQISYASTSRILSDKSRYKSFMRTVPSDEFQAEAMADFVHRFEWNYVFLIASDDDYGKMAAAAFKTAAKNLNICIADDEFIAFRAEKSDEIIRSTIKKLKNSPRAKVVIVFSYLQQGERLLREADRTNITDRTWVTSDAWASGIANLNISKTTLAGMFTFSIKSKRLQSFEEFLRNLTVQHAQTNYWWGRFLEEKLRCQITNHSTSNSNRRCELNEKLPRDYQFGTEMVANVIDAVRTATFAIHSVLSTCLQQKQNISCFATVASIPADVLLASAKNVSFTGADGTPVTFNENGDVTTSKYVIRNVQLGVNETLTYVEVGAWTKTDGHKEFRVEEDRIMWNSRMKPQSTCFRECNPGERVVGQSECCWNCQKCEKGTVSSVSGSFKCTKCDETHYANEKQTLCLTRKVHHLDASHPAAISIITLSCIGIVMTTVIAVIFVRMRNTPILPSTSVFLVCLFFGTLFFTFIFAMAHLSVPSDGVCVLLDVLLQLLLILYAALLLANTQNTTLALKSVLARLIDMRIVYIHMVLVSALVLLQAVFIIAWEVTSPSSAQFTNQEDNSRLLECKAAFPPSRLVATVFPLFILSLATLMAFRERNRPENFNESKFISFATIALCILLVAFVPTYRYVVGISRILVVAFTAFVAAFSCMGCIFVPKLYIIFMRPERNTDKEADCIAGDCSPRPGASPGNQSPQMESVAINDELDQSQDSRVVDQQDVTTATTANGGRMQSSSFSKVKFDLDPVPEQTAEELTGSSNAAYERDTMEDSAHASGIVFL